MDYYEMLERIKETAALLQRSPIPGCKESQGMNMGRLEVAAESLRRMLVEVTPQAEVWCGDASDILRGGRPLAADWDRLVRPFYDKDSESAPNAAG